MGERHRARRLAVVALYQADLLGESASQRLRRLVDESEGRDVPRSAEGRAFARQLVEGFDLHGPAVDRALREAGARWELERMSATDRAVLRMAVCELLLIRDIPGPVTINEAIELAKEYGDDASGRFVNGVLDAVRRRLETRDEAPGVIPPPAGQEA